MESSLFEFSAGYYMVEGAEPIPYTGEKPAAPTRLVDYLTQHVEEPYIWIDSEHLRISPDGSVPQDTVALPGRLEFSRDDPILIAKQPPTDVT